MIAIKPVSSQSFKAGLPQHLHCSAYKASSVQLTHLQQSYIYKHSIDSYKILHTDKHYKNALH